MALLIDGYNLMHAVAIVGRGQGPGSFERSRIALLDAIAARVDDATRVQTTVVFDAQNAPRGLPDVLIYHGITVRFARDYPHADDLIEELIQADSAPRRLTVVSSDHRVQRAARRRRATAVDSDDWYMSAGLATGRTSSTAKPRRTLTKPTRPAPEAQPTTIPRKPEPARRPRPAVEPEPRLSDEEVAYWLKQFDAAAPQSLPDDSIFPPGYAEDELRDP